MISRSHLLVFFQVLERGINTKILPKGKYDCTLIRNINNDSPVNENEGSMPPHVAPSIDEETTSGSLYANPPVIEARKKNERKRNESPTTIQQRNDALCQLTRNKLRELGCEFIH